MVATAWEGPLCPAHEVSVCCATSPAAHSQLLVCLFIYLLCASEDGGRWGLPTTSTLVTVLELNKM